MLKTYAEFCIGSSLYTSLKKLIISKQLNACIFKEHQKTSIVASLAIAYINAI